MPAAEENTTPESVIKKKKPDWFRHDREASRDEKLLQLRAIGGWEYIGLWWGLIEHLSGQDDLALREKSLGGTALAFAVDQKLFTDFLNACVEVGLLICEGGIYYSRSLKERLSKFESVSQARSAAGKKGAEARLQAEEKQEVKGVAEQTSSNCQANAKQLPSKSQAIDLSISRSLSNSNSVLSSLLSDPTFENGGGVKHVQLDDLSAQNVLKTWLSANLDRADLSAGIRAYDAWKGKKLQFGERVFDDDARALVQPWVMREALKLKNEIERLKRTRAGPQTKTVDWSRVFEKGAVQ